MVSSSFARVARTCSLVAAEPKPGRRGVVRASFGIDVELTIDSRGEDRHQKFLAAAVAGTSRSALAGVIRSSAGAVHDRETTALPLLAAALGGAEGCRERCGTSIHVHVCAADRRAVGAIDIDPSVRGTGALAPEHLDAGGSAGEAAPGHPSNESISDLQQVESCRGSWPETPLSRTARPVLATAAPCHTRTPHRLSRSIISGSMTW